MRVLLVGFVATAWAISRRREIAIVFGVVTGNPLVVDVQRVRAIAQ
jgi:hypothetical protein